VIDDIGRGLRTGTVVSVETTLPVGTTRGRIAPRLARASGLQPERDFFVVHSPERVYSLRVFADLDNYPKIVGGLSEEGEARAVQLYQAFLSAEVRPMGSAEAAELTKLAETTYRDVNIALANEFARFAQRTGVDMHSVIDAANSQPSRTFIARASLSAGTASPSIRAFTSPGIQMPGSPPTLGKSTTACQDMPSSCWRKHSATACVALVS
jgi:nucleotide sugar dehydrogenase